MAWEKERLHEHMGPLVPVLALCDLLAIVTGSLTGLFILGYLGLHPKLWPPNAQYQAAVLIASVLTPSMISWVGGYRPWRGYSLWVELRFIALAWIAVFMFLALLALMTKTGDYFSRLWLGTWFANSLLLLITGRVGLRLLLRHLRRKGWDVKRIVLAGSGDLIQNVAHVISENPWSGFRVNGYFASKEISVASMPYLGALGELSGHVARSRSTVDQVWLVMPLSEESQLRKLLNDLKHSTVDIRLVPDMFGYQLLNYSVEEVVGIPVLNISFSPFTGPERFIKEFFDRAIGCGAIIATLPIMLMIALVIKCTSRGPVLYKQLRHGWDNKPFWVYKFRTMVNNCDKGGFVQVRKGDVRVTPLGRILRLTSLDELPQFFNVLQGNMSIVGPRPHAIEMNEKYIGSVDRYMLRHKVKPGITGWAQINGFRGETDTLEKIEGRIQHDLYYIENWSLLLDVKIILLTVVKGFWHKNAF